jgi:hypothetical protein
MAALIDLALFLGFCYVVLYRIPKAFINAFRGKGKD